jgi:hypothetical protein
VEEVRHRAAIAGYITDAISGQEIADAAVEIVGQDLKAQTQADGFFYFMDLPVGLYELVVSAPQLGTRYGTAAIADVEVKTETITNVTPKNITVIKPIFDDKANVQLPPTRLGGEVKRSDNDQAIPQATVRLRGSQVKTLTDEEGKYLLSGLQSSQPTVQVSATGFVTESQEKVTLTAGEETTVNFSLTPIS